MRYRILWVIGAAATLILTLMILGAKPKSALPGICIYEVSISALINTINIGWTLSPCQDLDIREIDDYHRLIHSSFQPMCPVYSIQTWPGIYLPVIDYNASCDLNNPLPNRQAVGGVFHAITAGD